MDKKRMIYIGSLVIGIIGAAWCAYSCSTDDIDAPLRVPHMVLALLFAYQFLWAVMRMRKSKTDKEQKSDDTQNKS
jgi:hypothetical protein